MDISYRLFKIGDKVDLMEREFKKWIRDFISTELHQAEELELLTSELIMTQIDIMNNQPSIKFEIFLSRKLPKKKIFRTGYVGKCFVTSVIFDEYLEIFLDGGISKEPHLKGLTIITSDTNIIGLKSKYRANKSTLLSTTPHADQLQPGNETSLSLEKEDLVTEISGFLDEVGCLVGIVFKTSKGKLIQAGYKGLHPFTNLIPQTGVKLHGIGGSYRKSGFDSIYFYYSAPV